jgi:hypothetical protein
MRSIFGVAGRWQVHTRALMLTPVSSPDLASFLCLGVSLFAATRDERRVVEMTRCGAARVQPDGRVFVAIPVPEGKRTLYNIQLTSVLALSAAQPTNYRTLQLKGCDAAHVDWPEMAQVTREHRVHFVAALLQIGLPESYSAAFWSDEFQAIAFTVREIFNQTPGPDAGLLVAS